MDEKMTISFSKRTDNGLQINIVIPKIVAKDYMILQDEDSITVKNSKTLNGGK